MTLYDRKYKNQSVDEKKAQLLYFDRHDRAVGICSCCWRHTLLYRGEAREGERSLETHHLAPRVFPKWLVVACDRCHVGKGRQKKGLCLHNPAIWNERRKLNHWLLIPVLLMLSAIARRYAKRYRRRDGTQG